MEIIIGIGLGAIVLLMFYKFVEKEHKIKFYKIFAGLVVIISLLTAVLYSRNTHLESLKENWISVEYLSFFHNMEKGELNRVGEKIFTEIAEDYSQFFGNLTEREKNISKLALFPHRFDYSGVGLKWVDRYFISGEKRLNELIAKDKGLTSPFLDLFIEDEIDEDARNKELKLQDRVIAELETVVPNMEVNGLNSLILFSWRNRAWDETRKPFVQEILSPFNSQFDTIDKMRENLNNKFWTAVNNEAFDKTKITFRLCNKRNKALENMKFKVSGRLKGRSTNHSVRHLGSDLTKYTFFESDIILNKKECGNITWTGDYLFFDEYKISNIRGKWSDGKIYTKP